MLARVANAINVNNIEKLTAVCGQPTLKLLRPGRFVRRSFSEGVSFMRRSMMLLKIGKNR
jgi:hypothetical protein